MTRYYISGPMRGIPEHNFPMFHEVEDALWESLNVASGLHFDIFNPARNFGGDTGRQPVEYMAVDLAAVIRSDVIVLLPGWQASEGATREVQLASWLDKEFLLAEYCGDVGWVFAPVPVPPARQDSPRADVLDEARGLITGDRNNTYGPPMQDFTRTAGALSAYGYRGPGGRELQAHDVAIFVMAVKLSRLMWTPAKRDSWVDIAGYSGCGYECAAEEGKTV